MDKDNRLIACKAADSATSNRVAVLAPIGRDSAVICRVLGDAGLSCTIANNVNAFIALLDDDIAAAMVTHEALPPAAAAAVAARLAEQPAWSDLPILLLTDSQMADQAAKRLALPLNGAGNVTVLVRPIPGVSLITAVQTALRARRKQYQVRDLIDREHTARTEAERANRVKDEFLAMVSHELRTPLSAISLWTHLLATKNVEAELLDEVHQSILRSAETQSRLIEDLLDVSRMQAGALRLIATDIDLATVAEAAAAVVRPIADAKGVLIVVLPGPVALIRADAGRVQQILCNLLNNAVKFTPADGRVTMGLSCAGGVAEVRVTDTGQGIAPEFLPHVFEKFRQADGSATRRHGGLGLGLSIASHLAGLHGGSIDVASPGPDEGATFTVHLPLAPVRKRRAAAKPRQRKLV